MRFAHIKHILETKGGWHAMERVGQVLWRFAAGRRRFIRMLDALERDWDPQLRITFCVAASLLRHHEDLIGRLRNLGHDIAAHGFYHSRMDILDFEQQRRILSDSHRAFSQAGVDIDGFRCPYLNYNRDTVKALQGSPYQWTSQHLVFWENGFSPRLKRLFSLYTTSMACDHLSLPSAVGRLIEVPITAPDDEMLVERFRVRDQQKMQQTWEQIFRQTLQRGELFHLLFHPERFFFVKDALSGALAEVSACPRPVWLATLSELAEWWRERSLSRWEIQGVNGPSTAWIKPPRKGHVLLSGQGDEASSSGPALLDNYRALDPSCERQGRLGFQLAAIGAEGKEPLIGLSPSSCQRLEAFLLEQGFIVERGRAEPNCAVYLDHPEEFEEPRQLALLQELEAAPPLLRLWRWPDRAAAAATVSSDVDSITLRDFVERALYF